MGLRIRERDTNTIEYARMHIGWEKRRLFVLGVTPGNVAALRRIPRMGENTIRLRIQYDARGCIYGVGVKKIVCSRCHTAECDCPAEERVDMVGSIESFRLIVPRLQVLAR